MCLARRTLEHLLLRGDPSTRAPPPRGQRPSGGSGGGLGGLTGPWGAGTRPSFPPCLAQRGGLCSSPPPKCSAPWALSGGAGAETLPPPRRLWGGLQDRGAALAEPHFLTHATGNRPNRTQRETWGPTSSSRWSDRRSGRLSGSRSSPSPALDENVPRPSPNCSLGETLGHRPQAAAPPARPRETEASESLEMLGLGVVCYAVTRN